MRSFLAAVSHAFGADARPLRLRYRRVVPLPSGLHGLRRDELHGVFAKYSNGDGAMDASELRAALNSLGVPVTDLDRAREVLSEHDADGNSTLDEKEFAAAILSVRRARSS